MSSQQIDIPHQPKNNSYEIDCDKNPGLCIYIGWCIIVTIFLVFIWFINRSNLSDDEYIEELKKLGYKDKIEAELRYKQIQNDINNYANSKVTIDCSNIYGNYAKRNCNSKKNLEIEKFKADYKKNKLNDNERKLLSLYKKQNIGLDIMLYAAIGYLGIPIAIIIVANLPWWYFLI
jgi:hypothetical protein